MKMAQLVHSKPPRRTTRMKQRPCLRCDRMFQSEGPHNRLCQACREFIAAAPSPMEEYPLGYL